MKKHFFRAGSSLLVSAVLVGGCAGAASVPAPSGPSSLGHSAPARVSATAATPSVYVAERQARDLGPVPAGSKMSLTLTLRQRDAAGLQALLAKGGRVTPSQWTSQYGPAPSLVHATLRALARAGISAKWEPGQVSLTVAARAATVESFFHLAVHNFVTNAGTRFYGPLTEPVPPRSIANEVVAITGTDDYPRYLTAAILGPNGVTPAQMASFYDMTPLRSAGINGSGVTVVFPEWAVPSDTVLDAYATKFGLPPFNVTVNQDPLQWGSPATASDQGYAELAGEAALDLEVVHGLAPGAQEIVYEAGNPSKLPTMLQAMVSAHPGAVLSSSIFMNACQQEPGAQQAATAENAVFAEGAAEGMSMFFAAGDRGAFACVADGQTSTLGTVSVEPDASSPNVTAVGGTTVFLASNGAYYKEAAWGEPLEQWGGGGGVSTFYARPSWQQGPGLAGITGRGVPDVSANADIESGWDIFSPVQGQSAPQEGPVGGTSAATPCWAAITALIDEDLMQQHLHTVGFANPALYLFGSDPAGLPAPAFHEITEGSNLHYPATAGWNPATGLGSPDVAHLADDFEWYERAHSGS